MGNLKFIAWIEKVIRAELGEISHLPPPVRRHVRRTYEVFADAYLGWLQMEEEQPRDWVPDEAEFKPSLVNAMAHFYSDHQYLVSEMNLLKSRVRRLLSLDCTIDSKSYDECVNRILRGVNQRATFNRVYADLKEDNP